MGAGHCPWGGYTDRIICILAMGPTPMPNMEEIGPMVLSIQGCERRTDKPLGYIYGWCWLRNISMIVM